MDDKSTQHSSLRASIERNHKKFPFYCSFDEKASAEEKLALTMPSDEEKEAEPQRVAAGRGSNI